MRSVQQCIQRKALFFFGNLLLITKSCHEFITLCWHFLVRHGKWKRSQLYYMVFIEALISHLNFQLRYLTFTFFKCTYGILIKHSTITLCINIPFRWYIQGTRKRIARFQKLTRNLFLTLHGHNAHRQQQQLSMFFARYSQPSSSHWLAGTSQKRLTHSFNVVIRHTRSTRTLAFTQTVGTAELRYSCMVRLF